jgi:hypothetical protein
MYRELSFLSRSKRGRDMEWAVGLIAIGAVVAALCLFREPSRAARHRHYSGIRLTAQRRAHSPIAAGGTGFGASAAVSDRRIPATAESVEELFEPVREEFYECCRTTRRLTKAAEKALATGRVDPAYIDQTEDLLTRVAMTIGRAETTMDQLVFADDGLEWKWWAFIEEIYDLEAEIEVALSDFRIIHDNAHIFRGPGHPP